MYLGGNRRFVSLQLFCVAADDVTSRETVWAELLKVWLALTIG